MKSVSAHILLFVFSVIHGGSLGAVELVVNLDGVSEKEFEVSQFQYNREGELEDALFYSSSTVRRMYDGVDFASLKLESYPSESYKGAYQVDNSWQRVTGGRPEIRLRHRYNLTQWTVEDGLPDNKVWEVTRDSKGYLWIATDGGLARFDGDEFEVYTPENTPRLHDVSMPVEQLLIDAESRLWVGLREGLVMYEDEGFREFEGRELLSGIRVHDLKPGSQGSVWIASHQGIAHWNGRSVRWLEVPGLKQAGRIQTVVEDSEQLWVGAETGLYQVDLRTRDVLGHFFVPGHDIDYNLPNLPVIQLHLSQSGILWIGTHGKGVWQINLGAAEQGFYRIPVMSKLRQNDWPAAARFAETSEGEMWVGCNRLSGEGGIIVVPKGREWVSEPQLGAYFGQLINVYADTEKLIWLCSREGLFRLRRIPFATLWVDGVGHQASHLQGYRFLHENSDGSLWAVGLKEFLKWGGNSLLTIHHRQVYPGHPKWSNAAVDSRGNLWMGHPRGGLYQASNADQHNEPVKKIEHVCPEVGEIQAAAPCLDGGMWLGSSHGVFLFDERDSTIQPFPRTIDVSVLAEDSDKRLWIGSKEEGLFMWDGEAVHRYSEDDGLNSSRIRSLYSHEGELWVGSHEGVNLWTGGRFRVFDSNVDLPRGRIDGIIVDRQNGVWFNHDAGVSRVDLRELREWFVGNRKKGVPAVGHYGRRDGLLVVQNSWVATRSCIETSDGRLWFAKSNGLVVTDSRLFSEESPPPNAFVREIIVDGRPVEISEDHHVEIQARERGGLEIAFTCTSLVDSDLLRIEFRMDGIDENWRVAKANRRAYYPKLPAGDYTFRVRAKNREGRWSTEDGIVHLSVLPHLWETSWFRVVSAMGMVGVLGLVGRFRLRLERDRLELKRLQSLEFERSRIARDIHDHLGSRLAQTALASGNPGTNHDLVKESMREMNELIWAIDPKEDTLQSVVDFLTDYIPNFLKTAKIGTDLSRTEIDGSIPVPGKTRQAIAAIVKEVLTNVVKHAGATKVTVFMGLDGRRFSLSVKDDGTCPLVSSQSARNGRGKANMRARAKEFEGSVDVVHLPEGTEVQLNVPL